MGGVVEQVLGDQQRRDVAAQERGAELPRHVAQHDDDERAQPDEEGDGELGEDVPVEETRQGYRV